MSTQTPPRASKQNLVKEVFHKVVHKISKIRTIFALWPRDRRSRRSSNSPSPIITPSLPISPGEATMLGPADQSIKTPGSYHGLHEHGGVEPFAGPSTSNPPGANTLIPPSPISSYPGVTATIPGPSRPGAWVHLQTALTTLEKGTRAFPPLHSLARAALDCLDKFEVAASNEKIHARLAHELHSMVTTLNYYATELGSEPASKGVAPMMDLIRDCEAHINQQRKRGGRGQIFELERDREELANTCCLIESLSRQLQGLIGGGVFHRADQILHKTEKSSENDWLRDLARVNEASYNSYFARMQLRRRECAPGTRTGVQDRIKAWVNDPAGPKVLWMNGLPGMGKTTISYSLCKWLYDEHLLGASYFCSRTPSVCGSLERLIPTIAHQLAGFLPVFQSSLCKVLEEHPDSNSLEPHLQYERLLLRPLQEAKGQISKDTFIVIDGLDECEDYLSIQIHLEQLLCLPTELRIRLFITSRPEQVIYNSMFAAGYVSTAIQLHNIDESIIKTDIKNYIYKSLEEMSPTPTQIEQLADLSGNSFLYAATAVEYILPHHSGGDPATRLQTILMHSRTGLKSRAAKFYEPLYLLYSTVLEQVVKKHPEGKETEDLQLVLWTVVCAKEPMTVGTLAKLIGFEPNRIKRSLESLHSVLHVPERVGYVTVLHASFSDFIRNTPGPGELGCEETVHSLFMAQRCFAVMRSKLKFNICGLETSFVADGDVLELERRFESSVPAELFYACRYWSYHLQQISLLELKQGDAKGLDKMLSEFLSKRLLFWMEVLNLRGCMEAGVEMLFSTRSWLVDNKIWPNTQRALVDAQNFVTRFASSSCSKSTPHIYISALPSCPRSSSVHTNYWQLTQRLLNITGLTMNRTQDATLSRWLAGARVSSLACSSDGAKLASGSYDGTIQLWNTYTGTMIGQLQPIQGHNESVRSIEFSRDGALLAGSFHRTIVLYDITTATPRVIQRLAGNEGPILAFVFSSDGTRIVSGSSDGTVRLWAVETGEPIGEPLRGELECRSIAFASDDSRIIAMGARMAIVEGAQEFDAIAQSWDISAPGHPSTIRTFSGHEGRVLSMNLSPDGAYMVTAGSDQTIRLWQADTGIPINKPFRGHTSEVLVAKFSPDGTRLISGSADRTVRIWDVNTGSPIGQPFDGHSGEVGAIVVVPGGTWVVSGSDDSSIRLWDADTVLEPRPPVDAHSASVCSVTFSTESDFVLSGSEDGSVRGWDVKTGALKDTLTVDHKAPVLSVACSPDNRRYAAATRNGTFLVGDIHSGPRLGEPMIGAKHQDAVLSVAFSYEGSFLTTSSLDRTIRTWDPDTRTLEAIGQPLTYHQNSVTEVALARTGNDHLIVSASGDMTVRLCNLGTAAVAPLTLSGHDSSVLSIASSPNGECIISGSYDKTIRVWDGCTGNMLICITGHMGPVRSVALFQSPDGTRIIASGSDDKTVRLWEANSGNPLGPPLEGHGGPVLSVCFSPNGKYVASGSANGEIRLWDIKSKWAPCINGGSGSDGSIQPSQDDYANEPNSWCLEADGWVTDRGHLATPAH